MGSEWLQTTVGEFLEINGGEIKTGPFGTKLKASEYSTDGVPVISVGEVQLGRLVLHDRTPKVSSETTSCMPEYLLNEGDIVFGRKGAVERSARVKAEQSGWFLGSDGIRLRLPNCCDSRFIAYQFLSETHKKWMIQHAAGTTMASLNEKIVKRIPLVIPPMDTQQSIAHILGALDNKIELNRQTNQTLEQMAQALFKSWFVDFDPVIDNALAVGNPIPEELQARAQRRQQQLAKPDHQPLPDDVLQLFPSEFEETEELGWVPKGWEVSYIKDLATIIKGKSYKSSELEESNTALVTLKSFVRGGGYRLDGLKEYTGKYKPEQEVFAGDLVIAYTDVTQAADVIGKPAMVISDSRYEHLVISLDVAVVRAKNDNFKYYLYGLAQTKKFQEHTLSHSTGTTVLHLNKMAVPEYRFAKPNNEVLELYINSVKPKYQSIDRHVQNTKVLEKLRDTLLPKLISGELRLPESMLDSETNLLMDEVS